MGYAHFLTDEILISCETDRPLGCFSVVKWQSTWLGKRDLKSAESRSAQFYPRKKPTFEQKLTYLYVSVIQPLFSLYRLLFTTYWFADVGAERQTNMHTNKHTNKHTISESNFKKVGMHTYVTGPAKIGHVGS